MRPGISLKGKISGAVNACCRVRIDELFLLGACELAQAIEMGEFANP
jgi:hypothetical protein